MLIDRLLLVLCCLFITGQDVYSQVTKPADSGYIVSYDSTNTVDEILDFAKTFMGTPYRYAGSTPSGFDCSGFIFYVMDQLGLPAVRTSWGLSELGKTVMLKEVQPGDLLFFKGRNVNSSQVGHVGLVTEVGEGKILFIHASTSRGIVEDNLVGSAYYVPRFIKAKRMNYTPKLEDVDK